MAETTAERTAAIAALVDKVANQSDEVKKAALEAAQPPVPSPTGDVVGKLWMTLVIGLLILALVALAGVLYAALDHSDKTDADKALIVFTPVLSGLLGLFVASPTQGGST